MKQVISVSIGGTKFTLETEAYEYLKNYLQAYKLNTPTSQSNKVMEDLEERISEILSNQVTPIRNVVNFQMVKDVVAQLGMPNGEPYETYTQNCNSSYQNNSANYAYSSYNGEEKKIYRDPDNKAIGGVCGGLGAYFNIDPLLFRVIFLAIFFIFGTGLLLYIILWILLPKAVTPAQKCELRGLPKTAENISRFTRNEYR